MNSTDETQGEDVYGVDIADSSQQDEFAPPRRRRSTYTPPPQYREAVTPPPVAVESPIAAPAPEPELAPAEPAPAQPAPAPASVVEPATHNAIPDWSTGAPVYSVDEPVVQPLTPPPAWTPTILTPHVTTAAAEAAVESAADGYADLPDTDAHAAAEPIGSPPVWSLDTDVPAAPAASDPYVVPEQTASAGDHYRPWQPEPQPETTPLWAALFPDGPPAASAPAEAAAPAAAPEATQAAPEATQAASPVFMTPDDEAATLAAHAPPAGQPWIPQRRSLPEIGRAHV